MSDDSVPMSWEDLQMLYARASVALLLFFFVGLADFVYHMEHNPFKSVLDVVIFWFTWSTGGLLAMSVTVEVLYWGRVRKPARFHLKRLGKSVLLILSSISFLLAVMTALFVAFSLFVSEYYSFLLASLLTCVAYVGIILKLENTLRRYYKPP